MITIANADLFWLLFGLAAAVLGLLVDLALRPKRHR